MFRFFIIFLPVCLVFLVQAQTVATIQKGNFKQAIALQEVRQAYQFVVSNTLNPPSPGQFVADYVRYQIVLIEAYNDKTLLKSSSVRPMIKNDSLKKSIDQVVYKAFVENKMRTQLLSLNKEVRSLKDADLRKSYSSEPAFNFHFIIINIPSSANSQQIANIKKRAQNIYSKVLKDKRPFKQLVSLYSDNSSIGTSNTNYTKASLYPLIYDALKKLKPNQMSAPVRTPSGFYIIKLNKVIPFSQVNKEEIREQIFTQKRLRVFNQYFNKIKSKYKVTTNKKAVESL